MKFPKADRVLSDPGHAPELPSLPPGRPRMHGSPGCAPPRMECPWVGVLGRGRKETASYPGLLREPDPDTASTCPRAGSPVTLLGGEGSGPLRRMDHLSQPHAEGQGPNGEGVLKYNWLYRRTLGLSKLK